MSLRWKILLVLIAGLALVMAANAVLMHTVVYRSFADLERTQALRDHERVQAAITREQNYLTRMCSDWSYWNDTYAFAVDHNQAYVASNLEPATFTNNKLCSIYIYDADGRRIWGETRNPHAPEAPVIEVSQFPEQLPAGHALRLKTPDDQAEGLMTTDAGLMLLSAQPILTTNGDGPLRGTLIMARLFDESLQEHLCEQTKVPVQLEQVSGRGTAVDPQPTVVQADAEDATVASALLDIVGRPVAVLTTATPRDVTQKGMDTIEYVSLLVVALVLLAYVLMVGALGVFVIRPIHRLKVYMRRFVEHDDAAADIQLHCSGELGDLSEEFNSLIAELQRRNEEKQSILRRHEEMVSNLPIGLYRAEAGPDGQLLMVNAALCELLGYDGPDELCHTPKGALYVDQESLQAATEELEERGRLIDRQIEMRRRDGSRFWASLTAQLVREDTGVQYVDVAVLDIAMRIEAEEQLGRSLEELKQFNELAIGRELRMVELKREVNELSRELGRDEPYRITLDMPEQTIRP